MAGSGGQEQARAHTPDWRAGSLCRWARWAVRARARMMWMRLQPHGAPPSSSQCPQVSLLHPEPHLASALCACPPPRALECAPPPPSRRPPCCLPFCRTPAGVGLSLGFSESRSVVALETREAVTLFEEKQVHASVFSKGLHVVSARPPAAAPGPPCPTGPAAPLPGRWRWEWAPRLRREAAARHCPGTGSCWGGTPLGTRAGYFRRWMAAYSLTCPSTVSQHQRSCLAPCWAGLRGLRCCVQQGLVPGSRRREATIATCCRPSMPLPTRRRAGDRALGTDEPRGLLQWPRRAQGEAGQPAAGCCSGAGAMRVRGACESGHWLRAHASLPGVP